MDAMGVELAEQPQAWASLWARRAEVGERLSALSLSRIRRVVVAGCGDCHAAAEYAESVVELRTGYSVRGLPAMELSRARPHLLDSETLLVALSVSGRTPRVLEAVRLARARGAAVLALTDDPAGPLAGEADEFFVLGTAPPETLAGTDYRDPEAAQYRGYHRAVPQTKTYGAMQLALALVCLELERRFPSGRGSPRGEVEASLAGLPDLAAAVSDAGIQVGEELLRGARRRARVTFCGTGPNASTARFGAYKLLELACPAASGDIEEYCHTHYLVTGVGDAVVLLVHDAPTRDRAAEIAPVLASEIGAVPLVLGTDPGGDRPPRVRLPPVPPEAAPLLLAHAAAHAVRTVARDWGVDTDRFRAGVEEERYVRGSTRMIRNSAIWPGP